METAIYNLSVGATHRGRVYLSVRPDLKLRLDVAYPDDAPMQIEAQTPRDLVAQFRAVMKDKHGDKQPSLTPASAAELEGFQQRFREGRYALEELFSHDRPSA
jgi:hypothetical protein